MTDEEEYEARTAAYRAKKATVLPLIVADIETAVQAALRKVVVDRNTLVGRLEVLAATPQWNRDEGSTETAADAVWKKVKVKVSFKEPGQ